MSILNSRQMILDLYKALARDRDFLDHIEISTDPYTLNLIGLGLRRRYYDYSRPADLERAIKLLEIAVEKTVFTSPEWAGCVYHLGKTCYLYYACMSNPAYLEQAIQLAEQLIEHTPLSSPFLARFSHYLALYLMVRAKQTNNIRDVQRAARAWRECIRSAPLLSTRKGLYTRNLFSCLQTYSRMEQHAMSLDDAIDSLKLFVCEHAIEASKCSTMITMLADYMMKYYFEHRYPSDLNAIILCWEYVLQHTPLTISYWPDLNRMLAMALFTRFLHIGNGHDLERACVKLEHALYLSKPGSCQYVQTLYASGHVLMVRSDRTNHLPDLNRAISFLEKAEAAPEASPSLKANCRELLADALQKRYQRTDNSADLERAKQLRSQS